MAMAMEEKRRKEIAQSYVVTLFFFGLVSSVV